MKIRGSFALFCVSLLLFVCGCANEKPGSDAGIERNVSVQSTLPASSSLVAASTTTTRTPPVSIAPMAQCFVNADCGEAYLGSCSCDGDNLKATQYIPLCVDGSCIWKSKTDDLFCRGREYESGGNGSGQRCVNGFGRCIKNSEYERYMVLRPNVTVLNGTTDASYSEEYRDYSFRKNLSGVYPGNSMCYESEYFILDVKEPYGESAQIEVSWNKSVVLGGVVVKVGGIRRDANGTDNPVLWVRRARLNDSGYF